MQLDSQERSPIFYIVLIGILIFAIIFFVNNVKKAINNSNIKEEDKTAKASMEVVMFEG